MAVGITYGTVEHLEISLGDDGTQFNVLSTNAGTDTLLQTGGGDDTINVSSNAPTNTGTVDLIAGHLTIQGEGGTDTTNVNDSGDTGANTGTLTATDLTGLDMGASGITYADARAPEHRPRLRRRHLHDRLHAHDAHDARHVAAAPTRSTCARSPATP